MNVQISMKVSCLHPLYLVGVKIKVGGEVSKNVSPRNCIKYPDLHRSYVSHSHLIWVGWAWGQLSKQCFFH